VCVLQSASNEIIDPPELPWRAAAAVCSALQHGTSRLLTLIGPPGIGKTRLSVEAAETGWAAAFAAGRGLSLEEAVAEALGHDA
jgi:hypothetical protein